MSVLEASNYGVSLTTKDGVLIARTDMHALFAHVQTEQGLGGTYDPDVLYDPDSERFFIAAVDQKQDTWRTCTEGCVAYEYLAVSRNSSPQSFAPDDWYFYELPVTPQWGDKVEYWGDGTALGVSDKYLGMEMALYGWGNGQPAVDNKLRVFDKRRLVRGMPPRWHDFREVDNLSGEDLASYLPVRNLSPSKTLFAVQTEGATIMVFGVRGPIRNLRLESFVLEGSVGRLREGGPPAAPQPGDVPPLQAWGRATGATYRDGTIWFAEMTLTKVGRVQGTSIRLVEIDVSNWPRREPTLVRDVMLPVKGDRQWSYHPALAVDGQGNLLIAHASSGATQYGSVEYTWASPGGSLRPSRLLKVGTVPYVGLADDSRFPDVIRFADYFGAAADPADDSLWVIGQYAGDERLPTAWVANLRFDR